MSDPYQSVLTSIIASAILLIFFFVYRFVYPKRTISYGISIVLISILPLLSLLRPGVYESGDFTLHIYEAMSFYSNILEGEYIPRWGGELNATYGYPVFVFAYPLPNYLVVLFYSLGFSFINSLKLFLAASFIGSGICMYIFGKKYINSFAGFVSAVLYLFAPYHLVGLHYRVAIGEVLSFVFLPLNLLASITILKKGDRSWIFLSALFFALLILSHQAVSLSFVCFLILFTLFQWRLYKNSVKNLLLYFSSLCIGLGLSAFYWIPVLVEKQYTLQGLFPQTVSFQSFWEFVFVPWRYGMLYQGPIGQLAVIIGYVQWIIVIIGLFILLTKKLHGKHRSELLFLIFTFFAVLFFMQSISRPLWDIFPLFNNFQFSYRLLAISILITSVLGALLTTIINKKILLVLCTMAIFITILNWGNRRTIPEITDETLRNNLPKSTFEGEGNGQSAPMWLDRNQVWIKNEPENHLELLSGSATIRELSRTNTKHTYVVDVENKSQFKENTIYFPNWTLTANGAQVPLHYESPDYPGIITFSLPQGLYYLSLTYELTPIQIGARTISFITVVGTGAAYLRYKYRPIKQFKRKKTV